MYSYVVARDYGFAPNPFFGYCTLATCKPEIRRISGPGDWIIGTGTAQRKRAEFVVYAMQVAESISFNQYWSDARFQSKKPFLRGSKKQAFGDNIYCKPAGAKKWRQLNSHHSYLDGSANQANIDNDTRVDRVLVATRFTYWGGNGPKIPDRFRRPPDSEVRAKRGHRSNFSEDFIEQFLKWISGLGVNGYVGEPLDWERTP